MTKGGERNLLRFRGIEINLFNLEVLLPQRDVIFGVA